MSYPPYQGNPGQPPYGQQYPPQGYQPQQPPYPPQQHGQQSYPPQGYPPQQPPFGGPPQGYPPQQQPYGVPPQGYPPQQPYGAPPQGYPLQQSYSAPPQGYPPAGAPQGPPPGQYGSPAPYGNLPPAPPSPGYGSTPLPQTDMHPQSTELRDAMKGFGTHNKRLIEVLAHIPDPPHMTKLRETYNTQFKRDLLKDLHSETSGHFREGLLGLARGPLDQDVYLAHHALSGLGTKEHLLDDTLLGRSNADMKAIKFAFHKHYTRDLKAEVSQDLSLKTEKLFEYVLAADRAEENQPINYAEIEDKVDRLYNATEGQSWGHNADAVCQIFAFSSDGQLRAINQRYQQKYRHDLDHIVKHNFSGHMEHALRLMLARAVDRIKCDADQMEHAMSGIGTHDTLLVERMVRAHAMGTEHMRQVGIAYKQFHGQELRNRIHGETSGHSRDLMLALCP